MHPGTVRVGARFPGIAVGLLLLALLALPGLVSAATLSGSFTPLPPTIVDLTAEGTLDWAHWGLVTEWSQNHRYGMPRQINSSFVTDAYFTDGPYLLDGGTTAFSWTNGSPSRTVGTTTNGASIFGDKLPGNTPTGFQLRCLADTAPRRLKVYVATSGAQATFSASLSGASTYTDHSLNGATGPLNGVYTLSFQAGYPGQTLMVSLTSTDTSGYITLQAATLTGTDAPPEVAITAPADGAVFSAPATFSLTATASDSDGTVTNLTLLDSVTVLGRAAGGSVCSLSLTLSNLPAGACNFLAVASDSLGLSVTSFPATIYILTNGGTLLGSVGTPPATVDLTAEGTADWAHWGLTTNSSFDHKSGVVQQIPNVVPLNASPSDFNQYAGNFSAYSWIDGTPTAEAFSSTTGIFIYGTNDPPGGFQLTVPATNILRRLKVYAGLYGAQGKLTAWMSDWSAPPYCDSSLARVYDNGYAVYTLTFASANLGANLNLTWVPVVLFDANYGNVTWQAATLWQQPPPPVLQVVSPPAPNPFALSFYAEAGADYTVLFADAVDSTNWQTLTNFAGAGGNALIVDPGFGSSQRFYRVQVQ